MSKDTQSNVKSPRRWIVFLIILLCLTASIFTVVFVWQTVFRQPSSGNTPAVQPSNPQDPYADWKVYTDKALGYSIRYPDIWELHDVSDQYSDYSPSTVGLTAGGSRYSIYLGSFAVLSTSGALCANADCQDGGKVDVSVQAETRSVAVVRASYQKEYSDRDYFAFQYQPFPDKPQLMVTVVYKDAIELEEILPILSTIAIQEVPPKIDPNRHLGYVKSVYSKNGAWYIDIDYIEMLSDENMEATRACLEDGMCDKESCQPNAQLHPCMPNGYYIRNQDIQTKSFRIQDNLKIQTATFSPILHGDGSNYEPGSFVTLSQWRLLFHQDEQQNHINGPPYWITIKNGVVVGIEEQYLP